MYLTKNAFLSCRLAKIRHRPKASIIYSLPSSAHVKGCWLHSIYSNASFRLWLLLQDMEVPKRTDTIAREYACVYVYVVRIGREMTTYFCETRKKTKNG